MPADSTRPSAGGQVTLSELAWLLGTWRGSGGAEAFYEQYRLSNDSTIEITYFTDSTRTATQPARGTVEQRAGRIYHTYESSRWVASEASPRSLGFTPVERAGNRFRWSYESPSRWHAVLTQKDSTGRDVARSYVMERLAP